MEKLPFSSKKPAGSETTPSDHLVSLQSTDPECFTTQTCGCSLCRMFIGIAFSNIQWLHILDGSICFSKTTVTTFTLHITVQCLALIVPSQISKHPQYTKKFFYGQKNNLLLLLYGKTWLGERPLKGCFAVCLEQTSSVPAKTESLSTKATTPSTDSTQPAKASQGDVPALQPVMGISQRVHTGPKKKKDLGTIGMLCFFAL